MGYRDDSPFGVGRVLVDALPKWVSIETTFYFLEFIDENHVNFPFCLIVYAKLVNTGQCKASKKERRKGVYDQIFILRTG